MPENVPSLNVISLSKAARVAWATEANNNPGLQLECLWPEHPLKQVLLNDARACRARELAKNELVAALDFPSGSSVRLMPREQMADLVRQGFVAGTGFGLRVPCVNCVDLLQMPVCADAAKALKNGKPELGHSARDTALEVRLLIFAAAMQAQQDVWSIVTLYKAHTIQAVMRKLIPKSLGIFRRALGHLNDAGMVRILQQDTILLLGMKRPAAVLGASAAEPASNSLSLEEQNVSHTK